MALPVVHAGGVLPDVPDPVHPASLDEVETAFVTTGVSHVPQREQVMVALRLWCQRARHFFGPGEAWLAGTFVTGLLREPELRVVYFPRAPSMAGTAVARGDVGLGLLTLEDVFFAAPGDGGSLALLRPVGGIMDAYLGSPADRDGWSAMWALVGDPRTRIQHSAGFVSVGL